MGAVIKPSARAFEHPRRALSRLLVPLLLGLGLGFSQTPPGLSAQLTPWPPPGWPEGRAGEVRLALGNPLAPSEVLAKGAVAADGRFTLALPGSVSAKAYTTPEAALQLLEGCDFLPTVSPGGVKALLAHPLVYVSGEARPWGFLALRGYQPGNSPNSGTGSTTLLLWVDQAVSLKGSGKCGEAGKGPVNLDLRLSAGWNYVVFRAPQAAGAAVQVRAEPKPEGAFQLYPLQR
ncbi:hypothetical protein Mterra_02227 [Calidithermus terrae]|uniref:Uncharacterized protein n=1 Tax=Calidithermus terrae TaxID=1408545 RepID=A0A399EIX9_9DEIN|nr:hypothetical protein [Calidithermus terrae]RIH83626.1 hypothetical protein Mterra_02227 [Calidithermus terrae]